MAIIDLAQYCNFGNGSSTGYYAITQWATGATIAAGALRRQLATPTVGNERVFVAVVGGTTHASTEPTWTVTRGAKTTDNTVTWQECSGAPAMNGDATNTVNWTTVKNTSVALGQIIKRNNGASYQICTTAGTAGNGSEPSFSDTAGTTTVDNGATWTSLGVVGNFSVWGAPHARLRNSSSAMAGTSSTGTIFVGHSHAGTQTTDPGVNIFGTVASPGKILCVNTAGSVPPVSADLRTTATEATTAGASYTIGGGSGILYINGIQFSAGGAASGAGVLLSLGDTANTGLIFENCVLGISATGSGGAIYIPNPVADFLCELRNTTVSFAAVGQKIVVWGSRFRWLNTSSALQGTIPTTLLNWDGGTRGGTIECIGVDFSAAGSGKTILAANGGTGRRASFLDCKLNASVTKVASSLPFAVDVDFWRSGSSGVNYNINRSRWNGTLDEETTIIRTGGASDGTTGIAWKIVTTSSASYLAPFESPPIAIWNDTSGSSVTATIEGIWGGGAVPNNDDIWIEAEYLGASGSPLASFVSDAKADVLATAAGHTSSTVTWGGSTTKFKMAVTFTPQQKGWVLIRVRAGKASSTFYIDPKVALS